MKQQTFAFFTVMVGIVTGVTGQMLFYGQQIGVSFPLFTILLLGVVIASAQLNARPINKRNLWVAVPIIFFSGMVAVRANAELTTLNILSVLGLMGIMMHYVGVHYFLDEDNTFQHLNSSLEAWVASVFEPIDKYIGAWGWFKEHRWQSSEPVLAVVRGLLITVPVVALFAILLGSADVMFGKYVDDFFQVLSFDSLPELTERLIVSLSIAWMVTGMVAYAVGRSTVRQTANYFVATPEEAENPLRIEENDDTEDKPKVEDSPLKKRRPPLFQLGIIESGMLLGSLDILFSAFVLIQFTYFFGGAANITVEGFTYADYARRGFFELQAVSVLMLGLVLGLDSVTIRKTKTEQQIFQVLACVIVGLMFVIIGAASRRMLLYEDAYGFTHLRVYSHVFILWMGVLFGFFLLSVFRVRENIFSMGILIFVMGYIATLNIMNIDGYIASQNIARYKDGEVLDICYLRQLSVDALPPILELYEESKGSDETITYNIEWWLMERLHYLGQEREYRTLFETNLAKDYAWSELNTLSLGTTIDNSATIRCVDTNYRLRGT